MELPMLLYVMERNNMIRRILTTFALLLGGTQRAKEIDNYIGEVLHQVDPAELRKKIEQKNKVFEAWTATAPFKVRKMPTMEDLMKRAASAARIKSAAARFSFSGDSKDSLLPEGVIP